MARDQRRWLGSLDRSMSDRSGRMALRARGQGPRPLRPEMAPTTHCGVPRLLQGLRSFDFETRLIRRHPWRPPLRSPRDTCIALLVFPTESYSFSYVEFCKALDCAFAIIPGGDKRGPPKQVVVRCWTKLSSMIYLSDGYSYQGRIHRPPVVHCFRRMAAALHAGERRMGADQSDQSRVWICGRVCQSFVLCQGCTRVMFAKAQSSLLSAPFFPGAQVYPKPGFLFRSTNRVCSHVQNQQGKPGKLLHLA